MSPLSGKTAVVTGAAQGIGRAIAERFVADGASVVIADVNVDAAERTAADLHGALAVRHDVADESSWTSLFESTAREFGQLDVLVNNAGVVFHAPLAETDLADFEHVMRVNQVGTFLGIKTAVPHLAARGGSIINMSSVRGISGADGLGAYAASKFAVRGLTKVAALELGALGIRVNSIHPGAVATEGVLGHDIDLDDIDRRFAAQPLPRIGRPVDVAALASFLASDDSGYCTGAEFVVDGGATAGVRREIRSSPPTHTAPSRGESS